MSIERPGLNRAFVALQYRPFRLLFLSTVFSGIGGQLQTVANLWQVYALTESALHLGFTGLARAVPIILFSLAGGVIADRVDRRKIILMAQLANVVAVLLLAVLSATGLVQVWHIYAITFLHAALIAVSAPAQRAAIPSLVPRHHLVNAMALNSAVNQLDRMVAPALGGILIALFGLPFTYGINGGAHFAAAAALGFISLGALPAPARTSPLQSLLEGLAFVRVRSIIVVLLATDAAAMIFGSYQALLPIVAGQYSVGPAGYGILASAPAIGGFLAAIGVMYLGDFPYKGRLIVGAILVYCGFLVGLAWAPSFLLACVVAVGLGLTNSLQAVPRNALIQLLSPDELRGRVTSFQHMLTAGMPALGQGLMGGAAAAVTAPVALVVWALLCAIINVGILARRPDLRARDLGAATDRVRTSEPMPPRAIAWQPAPATADARRSPSGRQPPPG